MYLSKIFAKVLFSTLILNTWVNLLYAQKKCATVEYNQMLQNPSIRFEPESTFEQWIKEQGRIRTSQFQADNSPADEIYTIPVVVHIIHKGEALGSAGNVPDAHIFSQIDSLNKDFRRLNADTLETPSKFRSVATDVRIQFALAKRDPEGLATTGIIRKQGLKNTYSFAEQYDLKIQSHWPSEDYLNIWVTDISGGFIGYAQFPTSTMEGLGQDQSISSITDGVVIDWKYIGTNSNATAFASLGRTGTHEVGHYLGLKHIWGNGGCGQDDYCNDTPTQSSSSNGCPSIDASNACADDYMFQNYMDYTDDVCMNIFTINQSERMHIVMENSPRRKTLTTSKGATEPVFVANDLGIREIVSPTNSNCDTELIPEIEVRNYGSNDIYSFTVNLYLDDVLIESIFENVTLPYLAIKAVAFNPITSFNNPTGDFRFEIITTNGSSDGNPENNIKSVTASFPIEEALPYLEDFETGNTVWSVINSSNDNTATSIANAPNLTFENTAFNFNYFGSSSAKFGEKDWIISPVFDFSALPTADLTFRYAHAPLTGGFSDVLTVAVSTDCGLTFSENDYIFQKFSPSLGTSSSRSSYFIPSGPSDWTQLTLNLSDFAGEPEVVIAFIGHNGNGNNIYLDDINVSSDNILAYNLGIVGVNSLPLSTCNKDIYPTVEVKNYGFETITDFDLQYTINAKTETISTSGTTLLPGKSKSVFIPIKDLEIGASKVRFEVLNPNGNNDEQARNDIFESNFIISEYNDIIPVREKFEEGLDASRWDFIRADTSHNFSVLETNGNGLDNYSLFINSYSIPELGIENWLVSPTLDFTKSDSAFLTFKVSYAKIIGRNEKLEIKLSVNCGQNFDQVIYSKKGSELAVKGVSEEWFPVTEEDWKYEKIDLTEYTVWDNVKIAFIFTNQNGNNVFLDDIEFYNRSNPIDFETQEIIRIFPNPSNGNFNLAFDFDVKDDVTISLVDMAGNVVYRNETPNILNQEFEFKSAQLNNGIYFIHVIGGATNIAKRIIIQN